MELREKIIEDYKNGKKAEELFDKIVVFHGYRSLKPSNNIDKLERWDRKILKNEKDVTVQVKGIKQAHLFGYTWLELKNHTGVDNSGWLYGKARVLAIMLPDRVDFYRMDLLRKLVDEKVDKTKPILKAIPKNENGDDDYEYMRFRQYNGFSRRGDFTVVVSFNDIEHCKVFTMEYELEKVLDYDKEISCI